MNQTAILIDDEFSNSEVLKYEIERLNIDLDIIGIYEDAVEGLMAIKKMKPDLIFLDIEMPKLSGFEVLDLLGDDHNCKVIFVTAYNQYAVNAFQYYAVDYLVKPVDSERLKQAILRSLSKNRLLSKEDVSDMNHMVISQSEKPKKIVIPIANGFQMIPVEEIIRCEADNNYTVIYLLNGQKYMVSKSLIHFEKMLSKSHFLRVHQSHLVNEDHVTQYIKSDGGYLLMADESQVPISRKQKSELTAYFKAKSV